MANGSAPPGSPLGRLHPDDVHAIAAALGAELRELLEHGREYVSPREFAQRFNISLSTVYLRADQLGAVRIGSVLRLPAVPPQAAPLAASTPPARAPAKRRSRAQVDLLPIAERNAA